MSLAEEIGKDLDPFDIICHVAWDKPPLTRKNGLNNVKKRNYFTKYGEQAQRVLDALLDKYADEGVVHIEERKYSPLIRLQDIGTPMEIIQAFGGLDNYQQSHSRTGTALYAA